MPADIAGRLAAAADATDPSIFLDPERTRSLLADVVGGHRRELHLLRAAVDGGVLDALRDVHDQGELVALAQRLEENSGLSAEGAWYAVTTWARVLGVGDGVSGRRGPTEPTGGHGVDAEEVTRPTEEQRHGDSGERRGTVPSSPVPSWGLYGAGLVALLAVLVWGIPALLGQLGDEDDEPSTHVAVPDLIDQPVWAAESRLETLGLKAVVIREGSDVSPDLVLRTNPIAGRPVERGGAVELYVSEVQPRQVAIPALSGETLAAAEASLEELGLEARVTHEASASEPGTVISSRPSAGTIVEVGSTVELIVAVEEPTGRTVSWLLELRTLEDVSIRSDGSCVGLREFYDFDPLETDEVGLLGHDGAQWSLLATMPFPEGRWTRSNFADVDESVCVFRFTFDGVPEVGHYALDLPWRSDEARERYHQAVSTDLDLMRSADWSLQSALD